MSQGPRKGDLYFVALLPPPGIQSYANQVKQYFANQYQSRAALKSPPHVTLQPPFEWSPEQGTLLETVLAEFGQTQPSISMTLSGFGAFPPRVIYINVVKTPELLALQQALMTTLATRLQLIHPTAHSRPFSPHLTVAFRDLSRAAFHQAWPEFQDRPLEFVFPVTHLTLLRHNGQGWMVHRDYPLKP